MAFQVGGITRKPNSINTILGSVGDALITIVASATKRQKPRTPHPHEMELRLDKARQDVNRVWLHGRIW